MRAARPPSTIHFTLCIPAFALLTKVETSFVGRDLISPVSLPTLSPSLPPSPPAPVTFLAPLAKHPDG